MLIFEWDPQKAESNIEKHGVSFEEGSKYGVSRSFILNN